MSFNDIRIYPPPKKKPFKLITKNFFNAFTNAVCMMGLYYT